MSTDLQNFFQMSHVDGVLYDIRDFSSYIHKGEYSADEAQRMLEQYLLAETTIDPQAYQLFVLAEQMDGADRYHILFNEKGETDWTRHVFEFYVSKDLTCIAQIDYVEALTEHLIYEDSIVLDPGDDPQHLYAIDEVREMLQAWLEEEAPGSSIVKQEEIESDEKTFYQFRVSEDDGPERVYRISPHLSESLQFSVLAVMEKQPQFTYLWRDDEKIALTETAEMLTKALAQCTMGFSTSADPATNHLVYPSTEEPHSVVQFILLVTAYQGRGYEHSLYADWFRQDSDGIFHLAPEGISTALQDVLGISTWDIPESFLDYDPIAQEYKMCIRDSRRAGPPPRIPGPGRCGTASPG